MSDIVSSIAHMLRAELDKPEWKREVLEPITKWLLWRIIPIGLGIMCLNFFLTIAAVSLVLYLYKR